MSIARPHHAENNQFSGEFRSSFVRNHPHMYGSGSTSAVTANRRYVNNNHRRNYNNQQDFILNEPRPQYNMSNYVDAEALPSLKRRKFSATNWESYGSSYNQTSAPNYPYSTLNSKIAYLPPVASSDVHARNGTSTSYKRDRTRFEDEDTEFMSRDQIERLSPSRKDGIDATQETHLRYSYCAFLQNLGVRLELPQTTIGTAMVLCHRFFVRRSHAAHDRFLIATAALFLAAKSEETPCPLNNVLRASSEIFYKQDFNVLCFLMPVDWFDQYQERVTGAEQIILTTLNFELNVQHPYAHLTSILDKLGLAQSLLVNLALSLVSEGDYRSVACTPV
ncbi:cyclin-T1-4-like isoform X2 [Rutidosis leptorrhynchoides]|uniref:cyclin-T1-4-like isoform X2 n=1 Tax=Rutidosis leptorrhynchoides TaxID=125765 RepID=UPI003A98FB07